MALRPDGFTFKHQPRAGKRGGGIGFLFRNELCVTFKSSADYETFEMMSGTVTVINASMDIMVIYRPPSTQSSCNKFLDEFSLLLDDRIFRPAPLLITAR